MTARGERTFHAFEDNGESQSFWSQLMPGSLNMAGFSIWVNPTEDGNATSDVLILGANLIRGPDGFTPVAEVIFLEDFFDVYWAHPDEGTATMEITRVEEDGERLVVAGNFSAEVFYTESASDPQVDADRPMTVTGEFSASLPKE